MTVSITRDIHTLIIDADYEPEQKQTLTDPPFAEDLKNIVVYVQHPDDESSRIDITSLLHPHDLSAIKSKALQTYKEGLRDYEGEAMDRAWEGRHE